MSSSYRPRGGGGFGQRGRPRQPGQSNPSYRSNQTSTYKPSSQPSNNSNYRPLGNRNANYQQYNNRSNNHYSNYNNVNNNVGASNHSDSQFQLWMGDLDPHWTESTIMEIWKAVDENPTSVKIKQDKISQKPMYCFVSFASQQEVEKAINKNGLPIPGTTKSFKLNHASGSSSQNNVVVKKNGTVGAPRNEFSIFIGDIDQNVTEKDLFDVFNHKYPKQVLQVRIMVDLATRVSKGFGFAKFISSEVMEKALIELNGTVVGGRALRVGQAANSATATATITETKAPMAHRINHAQVQPPLNQFTDPDNTILVVNGLESKFTENELLQYFISYGDIIKFKLADDLKSAIVEYYLRSSAETALLLLHGSFINRCRFAVTWSKGEKSYKKRKFAPLVYNNFSATPIRFDRIKKEAVEKGINTSSTASVNDLNNLYIAQKRAREALLNE